MALGSTDIPWLEGDAATAVLHRTGHAQIIASAGSGKTEVVAQRVASLLSDGATGESIVAFTFTEKAAAELKERIRQRVVAALGYDASDRLGLMYVGTIHGYCFRMLQQYVPRFETYTPLDANQLTNLLYREGTRLKLRRLDPADKLFSGIEKFRKSLGVVENELLSLDQLPAGDFKDTVIAYYATLDRYRFMSFGTQIVEAVRALETPDIHRAVTQGLAHLIVDEYQDVNPAQERLVSLLSKPHGPADLVVVGDDDQAIYQWRGADVRNIVKFAERYEAVTQFRLLVNRRSRPTIVDAANGFARTIPGRLDKEMGPFRQHAGPAVSVEIGYENEQAEAKAIAERIDEIHDNQGVPYRDIAILVRGRTAYPKILDALEQRGIPVQPGSRTGLFQQSEPALFGATFAWLAGEEWAPGRFIQRKQTDLKGLVDDYRSLFDLDEGDVNAVRAHLSDWRARANQEPPELSPSLVREFYALAELLRISQWDLSDRAQRNRIGTVARFTAVLADYEAVMHRARQDDVNVGEQVGGQLGGMWFYKNFARLLVNYANGSYDDFDGEEELLTDAVALDTIHSAKGLEWPVVFLPSLTKSRFPSPKSGTEQEWLLPRKLFAADRYEGGDADERRLFYVALTRARDWIVLTSHARVTKNKVLPSPYIEEVYDLTDPTDVVPGISARIVDPPDLSVSLSELEAYLDCPQSYLLRNELGFMPTAKPELGYGNAIHHVMRVIAAQTMATGQLPTPRSVNDLLNSDFYLPFANTAAHKTMRESARRLVFKYVKDHQDDLKRTWAIERPFELYLDGVVVSGRADVIYDEHDGVVDNLAIVDYKTSTDGGVDPLQLQVYADAGRREGLTVSAAFVHDLGDTTRYRVDVSQPAIDEAESRVLAAAAALKARDFTPHPEKTKCASCDVRAVCGARK